MTLLEKSETKETRQKAELKAENALLEGRLSDERNDRERLIELLEEAVTTKDRISVAVPKKRGRRLMWTGAVAGTAYLLGARAGRTRYTQIMAWVKKASNRVRPAANDMKEATLAAVASATETEPETKSKKS